jgi:hypothetical protein
MKKYMAYNNEAGSCEGAILVFANSVQEAKKLAYEYNNGIYYPYCDSFIELAVRLIKGHDYLYKLSKNNFPHVILEIPICNHCGFWGTGELIKGLCPNCIEE